MTEVSAVNVEKEVQEAAKVIPVCLSTSVLLMTLQEATCYLLYVITVKSVEKALVRST